MSCRQDKDPLCQWLSQTRQENRELVDSLANPDPVPDGTGGDCVRILPPCVEVLHVLVACVVHRYDRTKGGGAGGRGSLRAHSMSAHPLSAHPLSAHPDAAVRWGKDALDSGFAPDLKEFDILPRENRPHLPMDSGVGVFFNQDGNFLHDIPHFCTILGCECALFHSRARRCALLSPLPMLAVASKAEQAREEASQCRKPSFAQALLPGQTPGLNMFLCLRSGLIRAWYLMKSHEGAKDAVMLLFR